MAISVLKLVPPQRLARIVLAFYNAKWKLFPLLRIFGMKPRMGWNEFMFATRILLPDLHAFNPQVVVGLGVGGTLFGAVLAGHLRDTSFIGFDREIEWDDGVRKSRLVDASKTNERKKRFEGKRILVVNAEMITAETSQVALEYLSQFGPAAIKFICLDHSPNVSVRPDFAYVCSDTIIQKPWRTTPTYTNPDEGVRPG